MKKILIMLGTYFPRPLANGICVHQIALELKEMGYEVHAICIGSESFKKKEIYDGVYVYPVKKRLFLAMRDYAENNLHSIKGKILYKIAMVLNKIKKVIYLPFYPMTSPIFIWRYYQLAVELHKKHKFDIILSVYNPLEALVAGMMIKKRWKEIKLVLYMLDTLTNNGGVKYFSTEWIEKKGWQWERRFYKYADKVLNLKCHEVHHNKERYSIFKSKMEIIDIPLFRPLYNNLSNLDSPFEKEHLHWIYTGALNLKSRSPIYLLKLFDAINSNRKSKLHFYSRGNCEDIIMEYQEKTEGCVIRHGYVNREESINAICNAGILISIGNNNSDMIPSKIFEYMSTGEKIIHFYERENDSCIKYYKKYPVALLINERENFEKNLNKVKEFINGPHIEIRFDSLKNIFEKNTPQYTSKIINDMLM